MSCSQTVHLQAACRIEQDLDKSSHLRPKTENSITTFVIAKAHQRALLFRCAFATTPQAIYYLRQLRWLL